MCADLGQNFDIFVFKCNFWPLEARLTIEHNRESCCPCPQHSNAPKLTVRGHFYWPLWSIKVGGEIWREFEFFKISKSILASCISFQGKSFGVFSKCTSAFRIGVKKSKSAIVW